MTPSMISEFPAKILPRQGLFCWLSEEAKHRRELFCSAARPNALQKANFMQVPSESRGRADRSFLLPALGVH